MSSKNTKLDDILKKRKQQLRDKKYGKKGAKDAPETPKKEEPKVPVKTIW